jgi:hypothetical protein
MIEKKLSNLKEGCNLKDGGRKESNIENIVNK